MQLEEAAIRRWRERPSMMVRELFKVEPDPWQEDILDAFPHNQRLAMKASKGPGKTCVLSWIAWNFLLTRVEPKIVAISVSAEQLAGGFWSECALWMDRAPLLQALFTMTKTQIFSKHYPNIWWLAARAYSKTANRQEQSNTLAGLHQGNIMFILDESGSMPEAIMASAEAALASCQEGHIVQAGNPTHLEGPLYRACTSERAMWYVADINGDPDNPKRAPRVDITWAKKQIEQWGRDDPFVRVNVFGEFPLHSFNALIGPDEMAAATRRSYHPEDIKASPKVLGVDVALFGDDSSVMWPRQGLVALLPTQWRSISGVEGAGLVSRYWEDWGADACFIDAGMSQSWVDNMRLLGKAPMVIPFGSKASNPRYFNKRAEIYDLAAQWIKDGGQLPPDRAPGVSELIAAMTQTLYTIRPGTDQMMIEPKEAIKDKLRFSPDFADAFCLGFSQTVTSKANQKSYNTGKMRNTYNPYPDKELPQSLGRKLGSGQFDPYPV